MTKAQWTIATLTALSILMWSERGFAKEAITPPTTEKSVRLELHKSKQAAKIFLIRAKNKSSEVQTGTQEDFLKPGKNSKLKKLKIADGLAEKIHQDAIGLIWETKYKHPSEKSAPCTVVAILAASGEESTSICQEQLLPAKHLKEMIDNLERLAK